MEHTFVGTDYVWAVRRKRLRVDVLYDYGVDVEIIYWADSVRCGVDQLRGRVRTVIRNCHHAALIESQALGSQPEVYGLGIGSLKVFYTVETHAVVVRGFAPNLPHDQVEEEIAGGFYGDSKWNLPVDANQLGVEDARSGDGETQFKED